MASTGQDSDNMRAVRWRKKVISSSLKDNIANVSSKNILFNAIKESLIAFVNDVYGNTNDQKYRNCVDLLMLRVKSDLQYINVKSNFEEFDSSFKLIIVKQLKNTYCNKEVKFNYNDIIDIILNCVNSSQSKERENEKDTQWSEKNKKQQTENLKYNSLKYNLSRLILNVDNSNLTKNISNLLNNLNAAIDSEFKKFNELIVENMNILNPVDEIDSIRRLNELQIGNVQIYSQTQLTEKTQKQIKKKTKRNGIDLSINGVKINSQMIDDLSSHAVKSIAYELQIIKNYNESVIQQFSLSYEYAKTNAEFTNEKINELRDGFSVSKLLKKVFNYLIDFAKNKLIPRFKKEIVPILNALLKKIKDKLPNSTQLLIEKIENSVLPTIEIIKEVIQSFINAAKLAFRGIRYVFKLIYNFIRGIFNTTLSWFAKTLNAIIHGFVAALRGLWLLIWSTVKLTFRGLVWIAGLTWRLTKFAFNKIKNSKFGKAIGAFVDKLINPFKKIKDAIKLRAQNIKKYLSELMSKNGKIGSIIDKIKTKISTFATSIKTYITEHVNIIKTSINRGLRITRVFIRRKIINRFIKFPARRFMNWIKMRMSKFLGKKAAKKAAKSAMRRLVESLVKVLAKYFKKIAVKIISGLVRATVAAATVVGAVLELAITYSWLLYDIYKMYDAIKKFLKPAARELGYDLTRPAWFEKFLWENKRLIAKYVMENYKEFLDALKDALSQMFFGALAETRVRLISADKRIEFRENRWAVYDKYKNSRFPKIDPSDKKAVKTFLEKRREDYSKIIKYIVRIKKIDERMDKLYNEFGTAENENTVYKMYETDFLWRMDVTEALLERVMKSGLGIVFQNCYLVSGSKMGVLGKYAYDKWAEADLDTLMLIYNEAYAGIQYVDFLLNRENLNQSFQQYITEQKEFHAVYHLDIDKLKEILDQHTQDQEHFYKTANDLHTMLNSKYKKVIEDIDNIIDEDFSRSPSKSEIMTTAVNAANIEENNSFLAFIRKSK